MPGRITILNYYGLLCKTRVLRTVSFLGIILYLKLILSNQIAQYTYIPIWPKGNILLHSIWPYETVAKMRDAGNF